MKKINTLLLPLILLTGFSQAEDRIYSFIGVQTSVAHFEDTTAPKIGVRYGKQSENLRTTISYDYGRNSNDSYQSLLLQVDTGIFTNSFLNSQIKPYAGLSFGIMQHSKKKNDAGYLYGVNTGIAYILNDSIDLDLGYKFMKTSKFKNLDTINDLTFAMHYFY